MWAVIDDHYNKAQLPLLAATLFLSAFLLFLSQPIIGKMLLPYLGGVASVWTTCVLFFQSMLLLGYVYAHFLTQIVDLKKQILTHALILIVPILFLPFRFVVTSSEALSLQPLRELLLMLFGSVAVPFFVVSTTAPLLQGWFSRGRHAASGDPYFLYSASNAGSLLALMAYPFVIEPQVGLRAQTQLWFAGYIGLILLVGASAVPLYRKSSASVQSFRSGAVISVRTKLYWMAAAFVG